MNLLEVLSKEDKDKITRYVSYYGGANGEFIGVDAWLADWAKANQKLYKLLGNQLMVKIPYSYKKSEDDIIEELHTLFRSYIGLALEDEFLGKREHGKSKEEKELGKQSYNSYRGWNW